MIKYIDNDYHYGFHMEKYPSMIKTVSRLNLTPLSAMQIYISNSRSKAPPKFDYEDLNQARNIIIKSNMYIVIHGCLLYNLAGTTLGESEGIHYHEALDSTLRGLVAELDFGVFIGAGVVVHPGSQKNKKEGIVTIAKSIETVLTRKTNEIEKVAKYLNIKGKGKNVSIKEKGKNVSIKEKGISVEDAIKRRKIILENAAGEGTKICSTLEEIAEIINLIDVKLRPQVKVCIDTAHAFGKGIYDWGVEGEIDRFYKDFDKIIGLQYLELFHFNDSKRSTDNKLNAPFGSHKDRHEQLGKGYIFDKNEPSRFKQITKFMLEARKHNIPIIGEPPGSGIEDWETVEELLKDTEYPLCENRMMK